MTTATTPAAPTVEVVRDPETMAVLLDPERRRLLEALREEPDSASGLARRLGDSRQRLNYHLRALEEAGLLEILEERRRGNCVERVLRVVARRFVVDPAALGELAAEPEELGDRFSATYLIALAARAIRELAGLQDRAARQDERLASAGLEARVKLPHPEDFDAFVQDLSEAVARVVARHHDDRAGGRPFRVIAGAYPAKDRSQEEPEEEDEEQ